MSPNERMKSRSFCTNLNNFTQIKGLVMEIFDQFNQALLQFRIICHILFQQSRFASAQQRKCNNLKRKIRLAFRTDDFFCRFREMSKSK